MEASEEDAYAAALAGRVMTAAVDAGVALGGQLVAPVGVRKLGTPAAIVHLGSVCGMIHQLTPAAGSTAVHPRTTLHDATILPIDCPQPTQCLVKLHVDQSTDVTALEAWIDTNLTAQLNEIYNSTSIAVEGMQVDAVATDAPPPPPPSPPSAEVYCDDTVSCQPLLDQGYEPISDFGAESRFSTDGEVLISNEQELDAS